MSTFPDAHPVDSGNWEELQARFGLRILVARVTAAGVVTAGYGDFSVAHPSLGTYNFTINERGFNIVAPVASLSASVNNPTLTTVVTAPNAFSVSTFVPGAMTDMGFTVAMFGTMDR